MDRWHAMGVFVKVAELGGFSEAARHLDMSPPAVTRAIAFLEEVIGARLLIRTTRSVKLTDAGRRYFDDCRRILADLADANAAAAGTYSTPTGTLTITAPILFGQLHVSPIVTEYLRQNTAVTARMLFLDRIANLVEEGIDVAIRIGRLPDSDLNAVRVGAVHRIVCASPSYLAKHGTPAHPSELSDHSLVAVTSASAATEWRFGRDEKMVVGIRPRLICNLNEAAIAAALDGWGLTRVLSYQVATEIADGRLQRILKDFEPEPLPIHVVHGDGRGPSAKVRAFVDLAVARLKTNAIFRLR